MNVHDAFVQPTFQIGDLVTGITIEYRHFYGLVCPATVMRVTDTVHIPWHDEDYYEAYGDMPGYQSQRSSVGHHQHVVCGQRLFSGAILEKVIRP